MFVVLAMVVLILLLQIIGFSCWGEMLGRVSGKGGLLGALLGSSAGKLLALEKHGSGTGPSNAPSNSLFPALFPLFPGILGRFGLYHSCSRWPRLHYY